MRRRCCDNSWCQWSVSRDEPAFCQLVTPGLARSPGTFTSPETDTLKRFSLADRLGKLFNIKKGKNSNLSLGTDGSLSACADSEGPRPAAPSEGCGPASAAQWVRVRVPSRPPRRGPRARSHRCPAEFMELPAGASAASAPQSPAAGPPGPQADGQAPRLGRALKPAAACKFQTVTSSHAGFESPSLPALRAIARADRAHPRLGQDPSRA